MKRLHNKDEAVEFLNLHGDWALVERVTSEVLAYGDKHDTVPWRQDCLTILYVDFDLAKDMAMPDNEALTVCSLNMSAFKGSTQAVKGSTGAETIAARESVYGPFHVHAKAEQDMKKAMMSQPGWDKLNNVQKSAAEMIVHKLARVLNGSADYDDNWHDIAGYATLAENDIKNRKSQSRD